MGRMEVKKRRSPRSLRLSEQEDQLIEKAAQIEEKSTHAFMHDAVVKMAKGTVQMNEWVTTYSKAGE